MPASAPRIGASVQKALRILGEQLRSQRKRLGVSAAATAEAAGISRMTLYRIERGEASVTLGAYLAAAHAVGIEVELLDANARARRSKGATARPPAKIRLADFPQLKRLAWQLKDTLEVTPGEALEIYERNWRHVDLKKMGPREQELLETLLAAFGRERLLV